MDWNAASQTGKNIATYVAIGSKKFSMASFDTCIDALPLDCSGCRGPISRLCPLALSPF